jgi:hypothetical protein
LGTFKCRIISFVNRDYVNSCVHIWISFTSFSCLIAMARNFSNTLNKSGKSDTLIHDFRGNGFIFSPFSVILSMGLSYIVFIILKCILSIPSFLITFVMKRCWILPKVLLHLLRYVTLSLILFMCYITFIDLCVLNHSLIPKIKPTKS